MHVQGSSDVCWGFMGKVSVVLGCFLSVLGISLRVIEDFFRVGWFVLVFIWRFLKSWLRFDVN